MLYMAAGHPSASRGCFDATNEGTVERFRFFAPPVRDRPGAANSAKTKGKSAVATGVRPAVVAAPRRRILLIDLVILVVRPVGNRTRPPPASSHVRRSGRRGRGARRQPAASAGVSVRP